VVYKPIEALTLRADYTYTEAVNAVTHDALLRRPRHKASVDAAWQADDALLLDASVLYVGPRDDIGRESFVRERLGGYATVNLAATWQVIPEFALFGRVENLFDERYQDPDGFQRPGFGAWAGLKASL